MTTPTPQPKRLDPSQVPAPEAQARPRWEVPEGLILTALLVAGFAAVIFALLSH